MEDYIFRQKGKITYKYSFEAHIDYGTFAFTQKNNSSSMKKKFTIRLQRSQGYLTLALTVLMILVWNAASAQYFSKIDSGALVESGRKSYSASWGDYNNDGYDDIVIVDSEVLHTTLFRNNTDGTFTPDTNNVIFNTIGPSIGSVWGDYNNDGNVDLYICNTRNQGGELSKNFLYRNDGNGEFTRIMDGDIVNDTTWSLGAAWADYDNDGNLDLFVANFMEPNNLYHNNGDGTFTKIMEGSIVTDSSHTYSAAWSDYNNDGFQDLFVANYFYSLPEENDFLYVNNGDGTFTRDTTALITLDSAASQSASWGDFNNDGNMDLYVTVNKIASVQHNFLYENDGMGNFTLHPSIPSWDMGNSFGSAWLDFNNDGYLDLTVSNNGTSANRLNFLYLNNGDDSFTNQDSDDATLTPLRDFCSTVADYNLDGYPDIFTPSYSLTLVHGLYKNNGGPNNYISMRLEGVESNRSAIGARIRCYANGMTQTREVSSNSGQYCGSSFLQIFGLGTSALVDSITIQWPSGIYQTIQKPAINMMHYITEPKVSNTSNIEKDRLKIYPNPVNEHGTITIEIPKNGDYQLQITDCSGKAVLMRTINATTGMGVRVNLENISKGIYLVKLYNIRQVITGKLVVTD